AGHPGAGPLPAGSTHRATQRAPPVLRPLRSARPRTRPGAQVEDPRLRRGRLLGCARLLVLGDLRRSAMTVQAPARWSTGTEGVLMLLARLLLAWVFIDSGMAKLLHWQDGIAEVAALGLPDPPLMLALVVGTQLVGGLAVAVGIGARLGGLALGGFTLVATLLAHA